jgi:ATP-dependent Clp protease adaptor protein ClpS
MRREPKDIPSENAQGKYESLNNYCLVLFNDDINKFEFVVESLIDICQHDPVQAEQCTFIAHHKGKCDIKLGSQSQLEDMKIEFDLRGINTMVCQS